MSSLRDYYCSIVCVRAKCGGSSRCAATTPKYCPFCHSRTLNWKCFISIFKVACQFPLLIRLTNKREKSFDEIFLFSQQTFCKYSWRKQPAGRDQSPLGSICSLHSSMVSIILGGLVSANCKSYNLMQQLSSPR